MPSRLWCGGSLRADGGRPAWPLFEAGECGPAAPWLGSSVAQFLGSVTQRRRSVVWLSGLAQWNCSVILLSGLGFMRPLQL